MDITITLVNENGKTVQAPAWLDMVARSITVNSSFHFAARRSTCTNPHLLSTLCGCKVSFDCAEGYDGNIVRPADGTLVVHF